jgi:hypothetical protein
LAYRYIIPPFAAVTHGETRSPVSANGRPTAALMSRGMEIVTMRFFVLAAMFAASIVVAMPPKAHAGSCTTTCYGSGGYRTCNTYCY